jgi:hypothetical protein
VNVTATSTARPAAAGPERQVFRPPLAARLLSLFGVVACGGVTLFIAATAVFVATDQWQLGLVLAPIALFIGALTAYVWRDLKGKWGLRVVLDGDAVTLDLPSGRSLIHRLPAQHLTLRYDDIAAIETRLEAYRSFGMAMMQRAYVLRRTNGDLIFLFEERALATDMATSMFTAIVNELATRAGVEVRDLGMVEGRGGVLGVWGTRSADWTAPSLSHERQARLWRRAALTGSIAGAVILIAILLRFLLGAL